MAEKNLSKWVKYMAVGSAVSTTLAAMAGGGYLLGNFLDNRLGTDPWLKLVLMISGVFLGVSYLILALSKLGKSNDD